MKELIKIEEELAQLKNSNTNNEECLVIDAANVYLLESKKQLSLIDYFEENWRNSVFDATWSMCYTNPGEITTIKNIQVHCLECWMKYKIAKKFVNGTLNEDCLEYAKKYTPDTYWMIEPI